MNIADKSCYETRWTIYKYHSEVEYRSGADPYEVDRFDSNVLLNEGIATLQNLLIGGAGTPYDNTNAHIGVGDSTAAEDPSQTGLQATTNKLYKGQEASYPQISAQTTTWRSTFTDAEGNYAWEEFTVANGNSDAAINLNRRVVSRGTKSSGTWVVEVQITWS